TKEGDLRSGRWRGRETVPQRGVACERPRGGSSPAVVAWSPDQATPPTAGLQQKRETCGRAGGTVGRPCHNGGAGHHGEVGCERPRGRAPAPADSLSGSRRGPRVPPRKSSAEKVELAGALRALLLSKGRERSGGRRSPDVPGPGKKTPRFTKAESR